jgi:hypothetical protein
MSRPLDRRTAGRYKVTPPVAESARPGSRKGTIALSDAKILALKPPLSGQEEYLDSVVPSCACASACRAQRASCCASE